MPTVVFVHGTGVRQPRYAQTLADVTRIVAGIRPATHVHGCFWGEKHGARLAFGGASVPDVGRHRGPEAADDVDVEGWAVLLIDPLFELRTSTAVGAVRGLPPPGGQSRAEGLVLRLGASAQDPQIQALAARASVSETLPRAIAVLVTDPDALAALDDPGSQETGPWLLARAVVAAAIRDLTEPGADPPTLDGAARDDLVAALTRWLEPAADSRAVPQAVTTALAGSARLAWRLFGSRAVERRRALILDSTHPMSGDVLVYLSHGEAIRSAIAEQVQAAEPPVTLLGHSLGGIACLDLLVERPDLGVTHLVTVGSQAPLLYELGALRSLVPPAPLPADVPPWTNIYDPRDLLAFVGRPVFGEKVDDVIVEGDQPFPWAHSGYWTLDAVRTALHAALPPDDTPAGIG